MKLFLSEGFHILGHMDFDIITQIQACINFLNEAWMWMLVDGKIGHMRPPTKTQQSLQRLGFEPTIYHKNKNFRFGKCRALHHSANLTLYQEGQDLLFMFFKCHIDLLYFDMRPEF